MVSEPGSLELGSSFRTQHKLSPLPVPVKLKLSGSSGCSTSSRRRCRRPWCPEACLGRVILSHVRQKKERPLEALPSHSRFLFKKKLSKKEAFILQLMWRLKHEERRVLWHDEIREKGHPW